MSPSISPVLFSLQRFCLHDGPGIRTTVFFKGCPLRCRWCHNPESQHFGAELLFDPEKCRQCGRCLTVCPSKAAFGEPGHLRWEREHCIACGHCADRCLQDARSLAGYTPATPEELLHDIVKDRVFYEESGGGVTFSGGEALCQPDALEFLARASKAQGLHVAIDTCGHVPYAAFARLLPWTDLFLYDVKHPDSRQHQHWTGQDHRLILENLERLAHSGARVTLRLPLIEGVNASDEDIAAFLQRLLPLPPRQLHLLPYHTIGADKNRRLGRTADTAAFAAPSPERLEEIARRFRAAGFTVQIGG